MDEKLTNILYFSVKSLAAAGKFKNRRYKKETNTSKQTMGAFLSWFRGSQALDRIIKLERMGIPDDKIIMEINYMVKKVRRTLIIFLVLPFHTNLTFRKLRNRSGMQ